MKCNHIFSVFHCIMHDIKDDVFRFSKTKNSIYYSYEKKTCVNDMTKRKFKNWNVVINIIVWILKVKHFLLLVFVTLHTEIARRIFYSDGNNYRDHKCNLIFIRSNEILVKQLKNKVFFRYFYVAFRSFDIIVSQQPILTLNID